MSTSENKNGGRTHEPSLREVTADLDGLRELMVAETKAIRELMDERDRRYEERFNSADEKTELALASSEKAVTKAEVATEKRFDSVNEFRETLKDQSSNLMPRLETETKFKAYDEKLDEQKKELTAFRVAHQTVAQQSDVSALRIELMREIASLRESRSESMGEKTTRIMGVEQRNWGIYMLAIGLLGVADLIVAILGLKH